MKLEFSQHIIEKGQISSFIRIQRLAAWYENTGICDTVSTLIYLTSPYVCLFMLTSASYTKHTYSVIFKAHSTTMLRQFIEVPWMIEFMVLEHLHSVQTSGFSSIPLWPMSTSLKHLSLSKHVTYLSLHTSGVHPEYLIGRWGGLTLQLYMSYVLLEKLCYKNHVINIMQHCLHLQLYTYKYC
jgi:hypothetical protein